MVNKHDERRYGDTIECHKCGKQWDKDDPEPPSCLTNLDRIKKLREELSLQKRT